MRKTKRNREKKKVVNSNLRKINKIITYKENDIEKENLVLTVFNMISTEYIRYTKDTKYTLIEKSSLAIKRINKMLKNEPILDDRIFSIDLKELYKPVFSYLRGVNERIGYINQNKSHQAITDRLELEFDKVESKLKNKDKINRLYDFILGKELSMYYVHTSYAIEVLDNLLPETKFKESKYIKTAFTRFKNNFLKVEKLIHEMHQETIVNFEKLDRKTKITYILTKQCELENIKSEKKNKHIWKPYLLSLYNLSDEELMEEYESTNYLINKGA